MLIIGRFIISYVFGVAFNCIRARRVVPISCLIRRALDSSNSVIGEVTPGEIRSGTHRTPTILPFTRKKVLRRKNFVDGTVGEYAKAIAEDFRCRKCPTGIAISLIKHRMDALRPHFTPIKRSGQGRRDDLRYSLEFIEPMSTRPLQKVCSFKF
jgi:hypothetical protein